MAYSFVKSITIDETLCGTVDSTDFPMLFSGTYAGAGGAPDLRVTGSGGSVTSSSGYDIIFAANSDGSSPLDFEIDRYISTTGEVAFWVRIPTLSASVNTVIYILYGDASVTTFQGNINGTWNSAFKAVWHFKDGTTLDLTDSTSNARNGTNVAGVLAAVGQVDGCGSTEATSATDSYMTASDTGLPSGTGDRTISVWYNNPAIFDNGYLWSLGNFATANQCFSCSVRDGGTNVMVYDGSLNNGAFTFSHGVFYLITVTWTSSGGEIFVNGVSKGTWTNASQNTTLIGSFYVWETNPAVYNGKLRSRLDELRISNVVRSQSWITSEYNNQSSPSTFYALATAVVSIAWSQQSPAPYVAQREVIGY